MSNFRPLKTSCWEKFLTSRGFQQNRIKGSRFQWTKPGKRTIAVWGDEKQIPPLHLKTSCKSIGCTLQELYQWAEENC